MDLSNCVIMDTETTGLSPDRHEIWEIALLDLGTGREYVWQLPLWNFKDADQIALNIGKFWERYEWGLNKWYTPFNGMTTNNPSPDYYTTNTLKDICRILQGKHIIGAIPSFDTDRLQRLLYRFDQVPTWHYHIIDIEALTVGWLLSRGVELSPPWKSEDLIDRLGAQRIDEKEKHTALGDCHQVLNVLSKMEAIFHKERSDT